MTVAVAVAVSEGDVVVKGDGLLDGELVAEA